MEPNEYTHTSLHQGIIFYVTPSLDKLVDFNVWATATVQIFYSLGVSSGTLITMSSYNKFTNNCQRDAVTVALINCFTSVYAGIAIFAILGHMAFRVDLDVGEVARAGNLLAELLAVI